MPDEVWQTLTVVGLILWCYAAVVLVGIRWWR